MYDDPMWPQEISEVFGNRLRYSNRAVSDGIHTSPASYEDGNKVCILHVLCVATQLSIICGIRSLTCTSNQHPVEILLDWLIFNTASSCGQI